MKFYYGADKLVKTPLFGEGNPHNDYGLGFYMTKEIMMAELWAKKNADGGFVITYELDTSGLKILRLDDDDEIAILRWITILVKNRFDFEDKTAYGDVIDWLIRHFDISLDNYDVVIGYRADDSYFSYSRGFVTGRISLETLTKALKLGRLGKQIVVVSKEGFSRIKYLNHYETKHDDTYDIFRNKVSLEYHELLRSENRFENHFIGDLLKKYGK